MGSIHVVWLRALSFFKCNLWLLGSTDSSWHHCLAIGFVLNIIVMFSCLCEDTELFTMLIYSLRRLGVLLADSMISTLVLYKKCWSVKEDITSE